MTPSKGELVTEAVGDDGDRRVTTWVPREPARSVVFAADGGWHISRLSEVLESAGARSTMIVGVHGQMDDDGRMREYVFGFDRARFASHEQFFVGGVGRWVRSRFGVVFPAERTAVWG